MGGIFRLTACDEHILSLCRVSLGGQLNNLRGADLKKNNCGFEKRGKTAGRDPSDMISRDIVKCLSPCQMLITHGKRGISPVAQTVRLRLQPVAAIPSTAGWPDSRNLLHKTQNYIEKNMDTQ